MKRFIVTSTGYKYDRVITWGILAAYLVFAFVVLKNNDFDLSDKPYLTCRPVYPSTNCKNPFYETVNGIPTEELYSTTSRPVKCTYDWCYQKYLSPGTYGKLPPYYLAHPVVISFGILAFMFLVNHLIHNLRKVPHLPITENIKNDKILQWVAKKAEKAKLDNE